MRKSTSVKIKAVIFDLGNVLVNYDVQKAARRFSKAGGISQVRIWAHFFLSKFEQAYTRGEISTREFYREACRVFKKNIPYGTFKHYWNDIFWENPGMDRLLARIKKHYPLYLISNTNKLHFDHIKKHFRLLRHFKKVFPSHEVGARKPDPKIYRRVLAKIKLEPGETVFIDDMGRFIRSARQVGMHAIHFKGRIRLIRDLRRLEIKF
ncbi:MAG TPA: HAD family phosphatase [Candidatus Omnitrophota bacterium]|nr:HAD family phosphatase [Candidatus Omnitrophota bacterium]HRY85937.1 HAD family phosphatase [Candidatus Omnitrophota bacterium]